MAPITLFVVTPGRTVMHQLSVGNWSSLHLVRISITSTFGCDYSSIDYLQVPLLLITDCLVKKILQDT